MKKATLLILPALMVFQLLLAAKAHAAEVVAEGKAAGNVANARELALTDALREAVRIGAGVSVISATRVVDFTLDYDRVLAAAFGYVRNYSILESGLSYDGIYRVKVRAEVGEGDPNLKDALALKMIVKLKGSPRVALEIDELIEGVPAGSDFAKAWFEQAAQEMQMSMVDVQRMSRQGDRLAVRDEVLGDAKTAEWRRAELAQQADFLIEVKIRGRYLGRKELYGLPVNEFSLSADLRAIRPDTGAILVTVPMPAVEMPSELEAPATAARDLVHKMLAGSMKGQDASAWPVFRRIFANWIAELDLGTIMRMEFKQISDTEFDALQKALGQTHQITSVWPREFDSRGLSFMDVESRLDATGLKAAAIQGLGGGFVLDHATKNYLQFMRAGGGGGPQAADLGPRTTDHRPPITDHSSPTTGHRFPPWAWALIGAGAVIALGGIFMLGRRSGRGQARS